MQRMIALVLCGLLLLPAMVSAQCDSPGQTTKDAIVLIDGGDSVGSGVILSPHQVLTASHVVRSKEPLSVQYRDEFYPAQLISRDETNDLALLQVNLPTDAHIAFSKSGLRKYDWVWAMGYPFGQKLITATGRYKGTWANAVYTSASVNYGQSGGGLMACENNQHVLVGIVRAFGAVREGDQLVRRDDISIATGLTEIRRFLSSADKMAVSGTLELY